jgi:hypothetical protein
MTKEEFFRLPNLEKIRLLSSQRNSFNAGFLLVIHAKFELIELTAKCEMGMIDEPIYRSLVSEIFDKFNDSNVTDNGLNFSEIFFDEARDLPDHCWARASSRLSNLNLENINKKRSFYEM